MKRGLEWYKREPQAIRMAIMAARMTDTQAAVYNLIIDLIYEGGGETPNSPLHIAAHFSNMGTAKARRAISDLIGMGKLFLVGDMVHEKRAETEAKTREKLSEKRAEIGKKGGISSGESRRERKEINDIGEANALSKHEAEKEKEKEKEIEKKEEPPISPDASKPVRRRRSLREADPEFSKIWSNYPKQVDWGRAEREWIKARKQHGYEELAVPLWAYICSVKNTEVRFIKKLSTWLENKCWLDNPEHAANRNRTSTEDLNSLASISAADDVARLMAPLQLVVSR